GELVSRRETGSVLHDADLVARRMLQLVTEGGVESIDGKFTSIQADSICVHGDSPDAVEMAKQVKTVLQQAGVTIRSFVHP
ncbi:LamB/YcsF family protein, partial [Xenorhabdus bovienii]